MIGLKRVFMGAPQAHPARTKEGHSKGHFDPVFHNYCVLASGVSRMSCFFITSHETLFVV